MSRRYLVGAMLIFTLALLPAQSRHEDAAWEVVQYAGTLATLVCLGLMAAPLRPRDSRPASVITLRAHRILGWIALVLVLAHGFGAVLVDRVTVNYVIPSASWYQLAGVLSTALLIGLATTGGSRARRALWRDPRRFQAVHVVLSLIAVVALAAHVIGTGRYYGGRVSAVVFASAASLAVLAPLQSARPVSGYAPRRTVFRTRGRWIISGAIVSALLVFAFAIPRVAEIFREAGPRAEGRLFLQFPHDKHASVNCVACHHNSVDHRGTESCIPCHSGGRDDLRRGVEARFHDFCFGCHRDGSQAKQRYGPVARCAFCHEPGVSRRGSGRWP